MTMDFTGLALSSIISLVTGWYISRHFSARKRLSWSLATRKLLDPAGGNFPPAVSVFFDERPVVRLSELTIGIWNGGNQPLLHSDFVHGGLVLTLPNHRVIQTTVPESTRSSVSPEVTISGDHTIAINCRLLDKADGFAFTVYTDEDAESVSPASLDGDIVGIPGGPVRMSVSQKADGTDLAMMLLGVFMVAALSTVLGYTGWGLLAVPAASEMHNWINSTLGSAAVARGVEIVVGVIATAFAALLAFVVLFTLFSAVSDRIRRPPNLIEEEFGRFWQRRTHSRLTFFR